MHRIIRIGLVAVAVLGLAAPLAFARGPVTAGKKGDVELTRETRIGSTVVKPGHYRFQHQSIDGQHYLVVRAQSTEWRRGGTHYAGMTKDEVTRVPCRLAATATGRKIADTAIHTKTDADGVQTVTQIDIRGDTEGHVVTLMPQT